MAKERSEAGESFFFNSDPYQKGGAHLIHSGRLFAPGPGAFPQTGEEVALTCKLFLGGSWEVEMGEGTVEHKIKM